MRQAFWLGFSYFIFCTLFRFVFFFAFSDGQSIFRDVLRAFFIGARFDLRVTLVYLLLFLALFGGMIFAAYKAYSGEMFKLPLVGSMAEKWA